MEANTKRLASDLEHAMTLLQLGFARLTEGHGVTVGLQLHNGTYKGIGIMVMADDGSVIADSMAENAELAFQECMGDCLTQFDTEETDHTFWP